MARYYRSTSRGRGARDKYSAEHIAIATQANDDGDAITTVVAPTSLQGMRKVKHLTISLTSNSANANFRWALVYVPAGTQPTPLAVVDAASIYEPNQFVMSCGTVDPNAGPIRISTRLSRNLNSGDGIALIIKTDEPASHPKFQGIVSYAITLQ